MIDRQDVRAPYWYRNYRGNTSCDCEVDPETIRTHTGYSDFGYFLLKCPDCGQKWTGYLEG